MNGRQKEVLQATLKDEESIIRELQENYTKALADIKRNIRELQANPLTQSKAYQLEFQRQLETQVSGILDVLQGKNFTSVADYLQRSYTNGFVGNMYDLQGQGVPLVIPIDESQVLTAVQKTGDDFKLSNKKGISTKELKKQVQSELVRGLATQLSYFDIARNISEYGLADMHRAETIARTEGHRVQNQARMDAMQAAKNKGADIVKQWDSTLDGRTRPEHAQLDGQIRELDEMFEASGYSGSAPGQFGDPYMDCNCRCCILQRARWAVEKIDPNTGEVTFGDKNSYQKWDNENGQFIKCSGYEDFKKEYLNAAEQLQKSEESDIISLIDCKDFDSLSAYLKNTYGFDVDDSVKQLDFTAVQQGMMGIETVIDEFPKAKQTLTGIGTSNNGVMCAGYNGKINFNPSYYADGKPSVATCMVQGETTGFHPKNTGVLETGSHEMGHLLERTLIEQSVQDGKYAFGAFAWNNSTEAKGIISQACKTVKKTPEGKGLVNAQLKSSVSGYATKNDSECLAECVADYVANGENASPLSIEVWKMLKERLG